MLAAVKRVRQQQLHCAGMFGGLNMAALPFLRPPRAANIDCSRDMTLYRDSGFSLFTALCAKCTVHI